MPMPTCLPLLTPKSLLQYPLCSYQMDKQRESFASKTECLRLNRLFFCYNPAWHICESPSSTSSRAKPQIATEDMILVKYSYCVYKVLRKFNKTQTYGKCECICHGRPNTDYCGYCSPSHNRAVRRF